MKQNKPDAFIDGFTSLLHRGLLALLGITLAFFGAWVAIEGVQGWKASDAPANALRLALAFGLVSVAHWLLGIALRGGKGGCK